jgi:hypothetical protein
MWRHIIHFPLWNGFYEFISFKISVAECSLDSYSLAKVCWSFWKTCSTVKLQDEVYGQVSDINFCEYAVFYLYLLSLVFFPVKMFLISFPVSTLVAWCQSLGCCIWSAAFCNQSLRHFKVMKIDYMGCLPVAFFEAIWILPAYYTLYFLVYFFLLLLLILLLSLRASFWALSDLGSAGGWNNGTKH